MGWVEVFVFESGRCEKAPTGRWEHEGTSVDEIQIEVAYQEHLEAQRCEVLQDADDRELDIHLGFVPEPPEMERERLLARWQTRDTAFARSFR